MSCCKPVLYDTMARDKALVLDAETMAAGLRAMGWTERRPGIFGVGEDAEANLCSSDAMDAQDIETMDPADTGQRLTAALFGFAVLRIVWEGVEPEFTVYAKKSGGPERSFRFPVRLLKTDVPERAAMIEHAASIIRDGLAPAPLVVRTGQLGRATVHGGQFGRVGHWSQARTRSRSHKAIFPRFHRSQGPVILTATDGAIATGAEVSLDHFRIIARAEGAGGRRDRRPRRKRAFHAPAFSAGLAWCQGFRGGRKNPQDSRRGWRPRREFTGFLRGANGAVWAWPIVSRHQPGDTCAVTSTAEVQDSARTEGAVSVAVGHTGVCAGTIGPPVRPADVALGHNEKPAESWAASLPPPKKHGESTSSVLPISWPQASPRW